MLLERDFELWCVLAIEHEMVPVVQLFVLHSELNTLNESRKVFGGYMSKGRWCDNSICMCEIDTNPLGITYLLKYFISFAFLLPLFPCIQKENDSESEETTRKRTVSKRENTDRKRKQIRYSKTNHKMNIVADAYHVLLFAVVDIKLAELQMVLSCTQHYDVVRKRRNENGGWLHNICMKKKNWTANTMANKFNSGTCPDAWSFLQYW